MNRIVDLLTYAFIVAGILVFTRPGSQGPKFVTALTNGFIGIVQSASGQTVSSR